MQADDLAEEAIRATATAVVLGADADVLLERLRAAVAFGLEQRTTLIIAGQAMGEIDTGPEPDDAPAGQKGGGA